MNEIYDIGTKILFKTCFSHNSTQKAPPDELHVRIITNFCVDSEFECQNAMLKKVTFTAYYRHWDQNSIQNLFQP